MVKNKYKETSKCVWYAENEQNLTRVFVYLNFKCGRNFLNMFNLHVNWKLNATSKVIILGIRSISHKESCFKYTKDETLALRKYRES